MRMKVSDYIARKLVEEGITDVFMITGGGAMHLDDGLGHEAGLRCYFNHHEQACAIAAECYARIHNRIAAVCVTTGPGGTNAITGVVGGWLDSIPMLVLSGQIRYDTTARSTGLKIRAMGDQEFDITKAVSCMTKYSEMMIDPMRVRFCLEKALYLAQSGRPGPCWLDIPLDVQGAFVETDSLFGFDQEDYEAGGTGWSGHGSGCEGCGVCRQTSVEGHPALITEDTAGQGEPRQVLPKPVTVETAREILKKVRGAKRPVVNAGNGIRIAKAFDVFSRVVDKLGIPVVTGWNSVDCMYDTHPLYVGRAGHMGDRPGNFAVQNSDLVLSLGSRLSIRQVGYNYPTWAREAYVIANDIDEDELKKPTLHVDMPVHADVKDLLEKLELVLDEEEFEREGGPADKAATADWIKHCQDWKERYPVVQNKHYEAGADQPANVYAVVKELSRRVEEDQITVVGNGSACVVGGHAYEMKKGQRFISNSAIAAMGYDLPAAIGAWAADHEKDIILLTGDGSIQMNLQELQTIIHHRMGIKIFLINNGGYHSIRQTQKTHFNEPLVGIGIDSGDLSFPSMEKLAWAYGYPYIAAHSNAELSEAVEKTLATEGPVICEFFVDTKQEFEPKAAAKLLPDGRMVSVPLEDLAPFLSDEELAENMLVPMVKNV
ncbi:MAG: thiamine pyrophosphate-binding protein [Lachnospiraceae bacterium]|nr:thiamine pyrophosphate-binding protein [Lachnospiraceae bacterium]